MTLVMDLHSGKVLFVGDGRGADSLKSFRERLTRSQAVKKLKRQAYGYRDQEFFKLRILGIHKVKYAFTG